MTAEPSAGGERGLAALKKMWKAGLEAGGEALAKDAALASLAIGALDATGPRGRFSMLSEAMEIALGASSLDGELVAWIGALGVPQSPQRTWWAHGDDFHRSLTEGSWCALAAARREATAFEALRALEAAGLGAREREDIFHPSEGALVEGDLKSIQEMALRHPWVALSCVEAQAGADSKNLANLRVLWAPKSHLAKPALGHAVVGRGAEVRSAAAFGVLAREEIALDPQNSGYVARAMANILLGVAWGPATGGGAQMRCLTAIERWLRAVPGQASGRQVLEFLMGVACGGLPEEELLSLRSSGSADPKSWGEHCREWPRVSRVRESVELFGLRAALPENEGWAKMGQEDWDWARRALAPVQCAQASRCRGSSDIGDELDRLAAILDKQCELAGQEPKRRLRI